MSGDWSSCPAVAKTKHRLASESFRTQASEWTVVRASWFNQNFSEGEFLGMVLDGAITLPAGNIP